MFGRAGHTGPGRDKIKVAIDRLSKKYRGKEVQLLPPSWLLHLQATGRQGVQTVVMACWACLVWLGQLSRWQWTSQQEVKGRPLESQVLMYRAAQAQAWVIDWQPHSVVLW